MNADQKLDEVALKQYAWKNERLREACRRIAVYANAKALFYPDEICFDDWPAEDANCIGTAYRLLKTQHIMCKQHGRRPSRARHANGREIALYGVIDDRRLKAFIKANGWNAPSPHAPQVQQEML